MQKEPNGLIRFYRGVYVLILLMVAPLLAVACCYSGSAMDALRKERAMEKILWPFLFIAQVFRMVSSYFKNDDVRPDPLAQEEVERLIQLRSSLDPMTECGE